MLCQDRSTCAFNWAKRFNTHPLLCFIKRYSVNYLQLARSNNSLARVRPYSIFPNKDRLDFFSIFSGPVLLKICRAYPSLDHLKLVWRPQFVSICSATVCYNSTWWWSGAGLHLTALPGLWSQCWITAMAQFFSLITLDLSHTHSDPTCLTALQGTGTHTNTCVNG